MSRGTRSARRLRFPAHRNLEGDPCPSHRLPCPLSPFPPQIACRTDEATQPEVALHQGPRSPSRCTSAALSLVAPFILLAVLISSFALRAGAQSDPQLGIVAPAFLLEGNSDFLGIQLPAGDFPKDGTYALQLKGDARIDLVPRPDLHSVGGQAVDFAYALYARKAGTADIVATYAYQETVGAETRTVTLTSPTFHFLVPACPLEVSPNPLIEGRGATLKVTTTIIPATINYRFDWSLNSRVTGEVFWAGSVLPTWFTIVGTNQVAYDTLVVPTGLAGRTDLQISSQEFVDNVAYGLPEILSVTVASSTQMTLALTGPATATVGTTANFTVSGTTPSTLAVGGSFRVTDNVTGTTLATGTIPITSAGGTFSGGFSLAIGEGLAGLNLLVTASVQSGTLTATASQPLAVAPLAPITGQFAWGAAGTVFTEGVPASLPFTVTFFRLATDTLANSAVDWVLADAASPARVYASGTQSLGALVPQGTTVSGTLGFTVATGQVTAPAAAVLSGTLRIAGTTQNTVTVTATLNPAPVPTTLTWLTTGPVVVRAGVDTAVAISFSPSTDVPRIATFFWEARDTAGAVRQTGNVSLATATPLAGATQFLVQLFLDPTLAAMSGGTGQGTLVATVGLTDGSQVHAPIPLTVIEAVEAQVRTATTFPEGAEQTVSITIHPRVTLGAVGLTVLDPLGTVLASRTLAATEFTPGLDAQGREALLGEAPITIAAGTVAQDTPIQFIATVTDPSGVRLALGFWTAILQPAPHTGPRIGAVSPASALPLQEVTITGERLSGVVNFVDAAGVVYHVLPRVQSADALVAVVPWGSAPGLAGVSVTAEGVDTNTLPLTILNAGQSLTFIASDLSALLADPGTPPGAHDALAAALDLVREAAARLAAGDRAGANEALSAALMQVLHAFEAGADTGTLESRLVLARANALSSDLVLAETLALVQLIKAAATPVAARPHLIDAVQDTRAILDAFVAGSLTQVVQHIQVMSVHLTAAAQKGAAITGVAQGLAQTAQGLVAQALAALTAQMGAGHPLVAAAAAQLAEGLAALVAGRFTDAIQSFDAAARTLERVKTPSGHLFAIAPDRVVVDPAGPVLYTTVGETVTLRIRGFRGAAELPTQPCTAVTYDRIGHDVATVVSQVAGVFTIRGLHAGHCDVVIPTHDGLGDGTIVENVDVRRVPGKKKPGEPSVSLSPRRDCIGLAERPLFTAVGTPGGGDFIWSIAEGDAQIQPVGSSGALVEKEEAGRRERKKIIGGTRRPDGASEGMAVVWPLSAKPIRVHVEYVSPFGPVDTEVRFSVSELRVDESTAPALLLPKRQEQPATVAFEVRGEGSMGPLEVFLLRPGGLLVRNWVKASAGVGVHSFTWDGTDAAGKVVPPGKCFVRGVHQPCPETTTTAGPQLIQVNAGIAIEPGADRVCARFVDKNGRLSDPEKVQFTAQRADGTDVTKLVAWSIDPALGAIVGGGIGGHVLIIPMK